MDNKYFSVSSVESPRTTTNSSQIGRIELIEATNGMLKSTAFLNIVRPLILAFNINYSFHN